jgi:hypothetical protein
MTVGIQTVPTQIQDAPLHQAENIVGLPANMPQTEVTAPKVMLTQEQVDFLVRQAGDLFPTIKKYWPMIVIVLAAVGQAGNMIGKAVENKDAVPVVEVVKPAKSLTSDQKTTPIVDTKRLDSIEKDVADHKKQMDSLRENQAGTLNLIKSIQKTIGQ